ncbi:MAG TPA: hypothetical protein GX686_10300, partial [Paracoccus sp.]|nr:hypothetical protein [Paracoccus sp. (in: a-proteobacteria)]
MPPRAAQIAAMNRAKFRLAALAVAVAGVTAALAPATRAEDGTAIRRALAAAATQDWAAADAS